MKTETKSIVATYGDQEMNTINPGTIASENPKILILKILENASNRIEAYANSLDVPEAAHPGYNGRAVVAARAEEIAACRTQNKADAVDKLRAQDADRLRSISRAHPVLVKLALGAIHRDIEGRVCPIQWMESYDLMILALKGARMKSSATHDVAALVERYPEVAGDWAKIWTANPSGI